MYCAIPADADVRGVGVRPEIRTCEMIASPDPCLSSVEGPRKAQWRNGAPDGVEAPVVRANGTGLAGLGPFAHFCAVVAEDPSLIVALAAHANDRNGGPLGAIVDTLLRQHVRGHDVVGVRAAEVFIQVRVLVNVEAWIPHHPGGAGSVKRGRRVRVNVVVWRFGKR